MNTDQHRIQTFAPGINSENVADYENSDLFPVCTCIGSLDNTFLPVANTFHDSLIANGGTAFLNEIEGIGHTTNFPAFVEEMLECFNFIENYYISLGVVESSLNSFSLYPNPAKDVLIIKSEELNISEVRIISLEGKLQLKTEIQKRQPGQNLELDIQNLKSGIYILQLKTSDGYVSARFVKEIF